MKICTRCSREYKSAYKLFCRSCGVREWQKKNPEKFASYIKNYAIKTNYKSSKEYDKKHPESCKARQAKYRLTQKSKDRIKRWRERNPERNAYDTSKRRKAVKRATPKWVNIDEIKLFYLNRPKDMQVDHIIPLQGLTSSGLHVPWNLQYLTPFQNASKKNKLPNEINNVQNDATRGNK